METAGLSHIFRLFPCAVLSSILLHLFSEAREYIISPHIHRAQNGPLTSQRPHHPKLQVRSSIQRREVQVITNGVIQSKVEIKSLRASAAVPQAITLHIVKVAVIHGILIVTSCLSGTPEWLQLGLVILSYCSIFTTSKSITPLAARPKRPTKIAGYFQGGRRFRSCLGCSPQLRRAVDFPRCSCTGVDPLFLQASRDKE